MDGRDLLIYSFFFFFPFYPSSLSLLSLHLLPSYPNRHRHHVLEAIFGNDILYLFFFFLFPDNSQPLPFPLLPFPLPLHICKSIFQTKSENWIQITLLIPNPNNPCFLIDLAHTSVFSRYANLGANENNTKTLWSWWFCCHARIIMNRRKTHRQTTTTHKHDQYQIPYHC